MLDHRPYAGGADLQAITGLLARSRPAGRVTEFPSLVDVREMLDSARTGTSSENVAMQRTAESVGSRLESRTLWFSKRL